LPVVVGHSDGDAGPHLFPDTGSNCALLYTVTRGNADAAFQQAEYVCRRQFAVQRQTAVPLETRGLLADWDPSLDRLILHGAAKVPFQNRSALAAMLRLDVTHVDLIQCGVGGGFWVPGGFYPADCLVAFPAHRLQRAAQRAG